ncbi:MAG: MFS transporter [Pseudomonadota bacterium]
MHSKPASPSQDRIVAGSPAFRRINRAMAFGSFATFALLYCVQPLMPVLGQRFALTAAQGSWVLSVSTATLALALPVSGALAERVGRKRMMTGAMLAAAILTLLCACAQNYPQLLLLRGALGLALGGMPAVAMAYLSEEVEPGSLGLSMGLYIGGSAFGGMLGRMASAFLSDVLSWRVALVAMGLAGLVAAIEFWRGLPRERQARPTERAADGQVAALLAGARRHLADPALAWLFALGFVLMGCFVSLFNVIGYRLLAPPYHLREGVVGAFSVLYLVGAYSAVWAGRLADRVGRRKVLWLVMSLMLAGLLLTLSNMLALIACGMALYTFGFFAAHSVASSWVARRARAPQAMASALYLFFYYLGSSLLAPLAGLAWSGAGWPGVVALLAAALGAGFLIALRLRSIAPLPAPLAAPLAVPARLV